MITKNFKNLCDMPLIATSASSNSDYAKRGFRDTSGEYRLMGVYHNSSTSTDTGITFADKTYRSFGVGTGTTAPTVDDYKLENETTDLTFVTYESIPRQYVVNSGEVVPTVEEKYNQNYIMKNTATYRNDTDNDITITELGVFCTLNSHNLMRIMLCREVISPVTIHPGETYTFTVTIG